FSQLAISLINWIVPLVVRPRPLPRMDFSQEIPSTARTLVAVPTLLSGPQAVADLLSALEVRYLANRDDHWHFARLTDFPDAPQETMESDVALLEQARSGIEGLIEKYRQERDDIFFLLHRPRQWNAQEQIWMAHERKRGKLADLNAVLRGTKGHFSLIVG